MLPRLCGSHTVAAFRPLPSQCAAACRRVAPVQAKYGEESQFFDLNVSRERVTAGGGRGRRPAAAGVSRWLFPPARHYFLFPIRQAHHGFRGRGLRRC